MERACLWVKPTQRKAGSKDCERQILDNSVEAPGSSHTWTLQLNFSINSFSCLSHFELGFPSTVTKWTLICLIYLCWTWGRIQVNPLEMSCIIKSGSLSAHRGMGKRLQEDKSSQAKLGRRHPRTNISWLGVRVTGIQSIFPSPFNVSPSASHNTDHPRVERKCWQRTWNVVMGFYFSCGCCLLLPRVCLNATSSEKTRGFPHLT